MKINAAIREAVSKCGLRASPEALASAAEGIMLESAYVALSTYLTARELRGIKQWAKTDSLVEPINPTNQVAMVGDLLRKCYSLIYAFHGVERVVSRVYAHTVRKTMQRELGIDCDLRTHRDVPGRNMFEPFAQRQAS